MTALDQSAFLQALGWAVLNSLWQMSLLWILFNIIVSLSGSLKPAQKSTLAVSLLFTGFTWFVFTFFSLIISIENNNAIVTLKALPDAVNTRLNHWLDTSLPFASLIYIVLLIVPLLQFVRNYRYVQVLRQHNLKKINIDWKIFVRKISAQIGILRPVQIWVSDLITSPVTIGYLKPIILVPLAAITHLTPEQMEAVLLHELAHIRRSDYLINLLINLVQTILYFNPFAKAFVKTVERERERSCDEMVLQFQYDPHHYAAALLMLEKNSSVAQNMAMAASGKNDLLNRIERILKIEKRNVFSLNKMAGLLAGFICVIILNAVLVVDKPVSGDATFVFEQPGSPGILFSTDHKNSTRQKTLLIERSENVPASIENHIVSRKIDTGNPPENPIFKSAARENAYRTENVLLPPGLAYVNLTTPIIPELNKKELTQVKTTVATTKKVVENQQWKEVEKTIADVMTVVEKQALKEKYLAKLSSSTIDWNKLETKLKLSYSQLNWNKINSQLDAAMANIKLDSLQVAYTIANSELTKAEKMATACDSISVEIPMPDVSLEQIKQSKAQVQKNLIKIKAIRNKRVIHL